MATPASLLTMSPLQHLLAGGLLAAACIAAMPARAQVVEGAGLQPDGAWSRWQGRIGLAVGEPAGPAWGEGALRARPALTLLGDYYLLQQGSALPGSYSGGVRATGGLLVGARAQPWGWAPSGAAALHTGYSSQRRSFSLLQGARGIDGDVLPESLPYFGVGYTGLRSLQDGGWGFSADLGVVALRPRSVVRLGQQSVTDLLRDLQLSPMLQLGVSYAF
ncbi:MAG TPA: hypothetical protein VLI72_18315 [Methylibium sp.]|nr:hypothetical protein [Methylibium sp.]